MKIAAFDIGGTALKMGVMTREGTLLEKGKQAIIDSDGDQILQAMLAWRRSRWDNRSTLFPVPWRKR